MVPRVGREIFVAGRHSTITVLRVALGGRGARGIGTSRSTCNTTVSSSGSWRRARGTPFSAAGASFRRDGTRFNPRGTPFQLSRSDFRAGGTLVSSAGQRAVRAERISRRRTEWQFERNARQLERNARQFDGNARQFDGNARQFDGNARQFDGNARQLEWDTVERRGPRRVGAPRFTDSYPEWLDKLADDVTLEELNEPDHAELALIIDFLARELPDEEIESVAERLRTDAEFREFAKPTIALWTMPLRMDVDPALLERVAHTKIDARAAAEHERRLVKVQIELRKIGLYPLTLVKKKTKSED